MKRAATVAAILAALAMLSLLEPVAAQTPPPSISINDVSATEGNSGTTTFTFTARIDNYPAMGNPTFMVNYATENFTAMAGTCAAGADYVARVGQQVTFNRSNQTRPIEITVCGDMTVEANELFFVNLSNPTNGAVITDGQGTGTIVNDDTPVVRPTATNVSCTPGTVAVGASTTCTATVTDTGTGTPTTPQGTVTFSLEPDLDGDAGNFVPMTCTLTGGSGATNSCSVTYTPTARGDETHSIGATYAPAGTHSASSDPTPFQLTVTARRTSTTLDCPGSTPANTPITCTVTVRDTDAGSRSAPLGTVDAEITSSPSGSTATVTDCATLAPAGDGESSTCTVTFTANAVGSYGLRAAYQPAPASVHAASSGTDSINVTARTTSTTLDCPASTPANTPATCTVTVRDTDTAPRSTPLGSVDLEVTSQPGGSSATVTDCALTPAGGESSSCTATFSGNALGSYTLSATYMPAPASVHATSSGTDTIQVTARTTFTSVTCTPSTFEAGETTSCTATVTDTDAAPSSTPTGSVAWTSDEATGAFVPNPCILAPTATVGVARCTVAYSSTKASQQTITASYEGDLIHQPSSGSTVVVVEPGPPAVVTLDPPADENPVDTQHCVTATVTDRFGNPTPNIAVVFSVTGSNSATGTDRTDAVGEAEFCYTGVLIGIVDVIRAFADFDPENGSQELTEPSGTASKVWTIPPSTALCEVTITEGGWIIAQNLDRASFGGNAKVSSAGEPSGEQTYQDHGPWQPMTVKSTQILAVLCTANQATIFGLATIDGAGTFAYRIDLVDAGEPSTADRYRIRIALYDSGDQPLQGGNIQVHKP